MRFRWVGIMTTLGFLAGCGGGKQAGGNESPQMETGPKTYVAAKPAVNDYYSYKLVSQEGAAAETSNYSTALVSNVAADGGVSVTYLYDSPLPTATWPAGPKFNSSTSTGDYDVLGRWLGSKKGSACTSTPSAPYYSVAPLTVSVGMNWQYSAVVTNNCQPEPSSQTAVEIKDSAVAQETVTVAAGTFSTIKITRNSSEKSVVSTVVTERNCWWEPELGIEVKCVANSTKTITATGATISQKDSWEMLGYANQKLARKADTAVRFAGNWKGSYFGGGSTPGHYPAECHLTVDINGIARGYCLGLATSFGFSGTVGADGTLSFVGDPDYPGMSFTGKLDSFQKMSGVWRIPQYQKEGTWNLAQE